MKETYKMFNNKSVPTKRFQKTIDDMNRVNKVILELAKELVTKDWQHFTIEFNAKGNRRSFSTQDLSIKNEKI